MEWRHRHPFQIGQTVYVRPGVFVNEARCLTPGSSIIVAMRGHDDRGNWISSAAWPAARFNADDFTDVLPLPPEGAVQASEAA